MSRVVSDLFDICEFAHHGPENLFISLFKIIGSFIILATIYWPLALILLAVTVVMMVFSYSQNKKMRRTFMENRKKIGSVNASLQDSLGGIRVVQSFANEDIEIDKFNHSNMEFLESKKDNYRVMGTFQGGNNFFQGLLYVTIIVFGGLFIANGDLNPIVLATFALYINVFVSPIEVLVEFTEMFQESRLPITTMDCTELPVSLSAWLALTNTPAQIAADISKWLMDEINGSGLTGFRRFEEVMNEIPEIQDSKNAKDLKNVSGNIDFDHVSFQYNENEKVIDDVNLHIKAGEKIALVGPSGSGKTTLCSLLSRFYDVTNGSISIDGQNIKDVTLKSLRSNIGLVQQDVYLFTGTIEQNIAYGRPDASHEEIVKAAKKANIHDFIMSLPEGYDTFCGERGTRLSGGQKQRISIARVFLKNPKILILDEATSALDNESERIIQKSLEDLSKDRTCITIAHRLSTIRNADEIVVIDATGMHERGTHDELMKLNGTYAKYYKLQFEGLN